MTRYYSRFEPLVDSAAYGSRSSGISGSGWQSALNNPTLPSSITRLVIDPPFGRKKCDYTIEKAQPGRLIVTARRRAGFASLKKNEEARQLFTIPLDADVQRLQSYIEPLTHRLIIEIPRTVRSATYAYQGRSSRPNEYRIDCRGYSPNDLDIYLQGRDFIVQGRNSSGSSSRRFSRKITLPSTVDLSRVNSYFENGELRVHAPPKSGYYRRHRRHRRKSSQPMRRVRSMDELNDGNGYFYEEEEEEMPDHRRMRMSQPSIAYRRYSLDEDDDDQRSFQF